MLTIGQPGRTQVQVLPPDSKDPPPRIELDVPIAVKPAPPSAPATLEALLVQLEQLRKQKAELDAKEKALLGQLAERLKELQERMSKLGVAPVPTPSPAPVADKKDAHPDAFPVPDKK
jgi:hypothetical protein